jgi:hypothetical protein
MSKLEILRKARNLISDPKVWVDHSPQPTEVYSHCAVTAVSKYVIESEKEDIDWEVEDDLLRFLAEEMKINITNDDRDIGIIIGEWNDSHTHEEVLAAFDKLIVKLEKEDKSNVWVY